MSASVLRPVTPKDVPSSLFAPVRRGMWMNFPAAVRVLG